MTAMDTSLSKPKLILHAGTHKTGTTAIQAFAARHRGTLADRGILYPDLAPIGPAHRYPHHVFAHALADKDAALSPGDVARLAECWAETATRTGATVLLSAEPLYRHVLRRRGEPKGDWYAGRARYLDRLAEVLAPFAVEVVLVFRRPDDYVRSLYQENVIRTNGRKWASFEAFRAHAQRSALRYADNATLFSERFTQLRCLIYEDLPPGDAFCPAFFAAIGLDATGLAAVGVVRKSVGPAETQIKLLLNHKLSHPHPNARLLEFIKSPAVAALIAEHLGSGPFGLWESSATRAEFLDTIFPEIDRLRAAFFPERTTLFTLPEIKPVLPAPAFDVAFETQLMDLARTAGLGESQAQRQNTRRSKAKPQPASPSGRTGVLSPPTIRYRFPKKKDASWNSFERQQARYEIIRDFLGTEAIGAEVGVYKGGFGEFLLGHCRKLYLVDTWYRAGGFWNSKIKNDSRVDSVIQILKIYKSEIERGQVDVVIDTSEHFLRSMEDGHFDFLYLDTSHKYEDTLRELWAAAPKIRSGGHMFGDDYDPDPKSRNHGVYLAVNEFVAATGAEMVVNASRQWGIVLR